MSTHTDVFVIGAGPAGLTAAYCLTKENPSVIVIEKDPVYVGGISRTVEYKGFMFDIGGHRFFSKSKEVVDLWNEILPDDFIERPRLSRIYYGGKYYSYPLSAFEALRNLGIFTQRRLHALVRLGASCCPIENPKNFHDWVRNQFGEKLFSIFFKTYTEKVWGMSCDEISADWAAQRIKGLDLGVAVMNALKKALLPARKPKAGEPVVKSLIESFQYPRKGPGMMWEAAARKIQKRGRQGPDGPRARAALLRRRRASSGPSRSPAPTASTETYTANHVISSAPVRELVEKIDADADLAPACARAALSRLPHRRADGQEARPLPRQLDLHPRSVGEGRPRAELPLVVARDGAGPGMSCLGLEYFCFEGDGLWNAPDAELIALAKHEIAQDRPDRRERRRRRLRGAPAEGLSGLRRRLSRERRDDPRRISKASIRRCTWSAATACTSTTTRTTP